MTTKGFNIKRKQWVKMQKIYLHTNMTELFHFNGYVVSSALKTDTLSIDLSKM